VDVVEAVAKDPFSTHYSSGLLGKSLEYASFRDGEMEFGAVEVVFMGCVVHLKSTTVALKRGALSTFRLAARCAA